MCVCDSAMGAIMTTATRGRVLEQAGLLHPRPEAVAAPLFDGRESFFLALDKVQVKYEMLRTHVVEGLSVTAAAEQHGYSRAAFYLITAAFDEAGMRGLLDDPRGRRGPLKLTPEIIEFVASADPTLSGAQLALEVEARFGVRLHRRTVERARR
jgi:transposase